MDLEAIPDVRDLRIPCSGPVGFEPQSSDHDPDALPELSRVTLDKFAVVHAASIDRSIQIVARDLSQDVQSLSNSALGDRQANVARPQGHHALLSRDGVKIPSWHQKVSQFVKLRNPLSASHLGPRGQPAGLEFSQGLEEHSGGRRNPFSDEALDPICFGGWEFGGGCG
jgi:hypothetical protein